MQIAPVAPEAQVFVWDTLVLPFLAIIGLGVIDSRYGRRGLAEWLVHLGWDSCVLAAGAAPSVFAAKHAAKLFGYHDIAIRVGYGFEFVLILGSGLLLSWLKGSPRKTEIDALLALVVGGALLGLLSYIA